MSTEGGTRAVVAAMAANGFIALMKFGAWALTGASSMLAEAVHSVVDTGNQALLLLGGRRAKRAATEEHPFGYGRERYVFAFLVAIILFSLGGLFAIYEALHKYEEIVAESFSLRTAVRESRKVKGKQSWRRFVQTARSPELPVVLLEDVAALLGLFFALVGVGMTLITHNGLWDVAGTAAIGILLIAVAIIMAIETKSLLLGEAATPEAVGRIRQALDEADGVQRVIHLKTLHLGPEEVLVAAKIAVEPTESAARVAEVINTAEAAIRVADPQVTALYLEPDIDTDTIDTDTGSPPAPTPLT